MADDKRCLKKKHKLRLKEGPALLGSWSVSNHSYHTSKQHSKNTLNVLAATYKFPFNPKHLSSLLVSFTWARSLECCHICEKHN